VIDLHCHVLPGIDDGPDTLDDSLELCRAAYAAGTRAPSRSAARHSSRLQM